VRTWLLLLLALPFAFHPAAGDAQRLGPVERVPMERCAAIAAAAARLCCFDALAGLDVRPDSTPTKLRPSSLGTPAPC
jgi:hypothetical protein